MVTITTVLSVDHGVPASEQAYNASEDSECQECRDVSTDAMARGERDARDEYEAKPHTLDCQPVHALMLFRS